MHHYLFQPFGDKRQKTLEVHHVRKVFQNLAYADFDMLLCGHKHVSKPFYSKYGEHFDERAKHRYAWNCFRSQVGLNALPDQFIDDKGSTLSRTVSDVMKMTWGWIARKAGGLVQVNQLDELCNTMKGALENAEDLESVVNQYCERANFSGPPIIAQAEVEELERRLSSAFTKSERMALKPICDQIMKRIKDLNNRQFSQVICGSTTKACKATKSRSFNVYEISKNGNDWSFEIGEYEWQHNTKSFVGPIRRPATIFQKT